MDNVEKNLLNPYHPVFYMIQTVLWVVYGVIFRLIWIGYDYYVPPAPLWFLTYVSGGFIATTILAFIYWFCRHRNFYTQFLIAILATATVAVIWRFCFNYIDFHLLEETPPENLDFLRYLLGGMSSVIQLLAWSAAYLLIAYYLKYRDQQTRAIKAELQAKEALIKQLHQQISPHFLFNVLNSIDALLIKQNVAEARSMMEKLSHYLRQSLKEKGDYQCTLKEEIDNTKQYLEIEKIRFGDRLQVRWNCDEDAADFMVPSRLLQPLLENAIKHSISKSIHGGEIGISTACKNNQLVIMISNKNNDAEIDHHKTTEGFGIGLKNTQSRLEVFYGNKATLNIKEIMSGQFSVEIEIDKACQGQLSQ